MQELTKAEEQVMQVLWKLEKAFVKDMLEEFPEPKPKYNTVSTIVRILEAKGFVSHEAYGKTHAYYPAVSREEYSNAYLKSFMGRYFGGSFKKMVSFFVEKNDIDLVAFDELQQYLSDGDGPEGVSADSPEQP
jgi:predicted transcriptional regulator